jgi:hypothetical protein
VPLQAAALAGLVLAGPFADRDSWSTSFLHDVPYVDFTSPRPEPEAALIEPFARLAEEPARGPVLAAIWPPNRYGARVFARAQEVHRRRVLVVSPGLAGHAQLRFRNFVSPDPAAMLASPARFFVLHGAVGPHTPGGALADWPRRLRRRFGPPRWREHDLQIWDLDAVRARRASSAADPGDRARGVARSRGAL